jgi:SOS-response transcriptional repressor LexA
MDNPTTEAVYHFIYDYIQTHKIPPTQREIAEGCFINQTSVRAHLKALVKAGRLYYLPGKRRTLTLL